MENHIKKPVIVRNIRFKSVAQIELIKRAAEHSGISFNSFAVRILEVAAQRALQLSPDPLVDQIMPPARAAAPSKEAAA